jgi:hypothetical protein
MIRPIVGLGDTIVPFVPLVNLSGSSGMEDNPAPLELKNHSCYVVIGDYNPTAFGHEENTPRRTRREGGYMLLRTNEIVTIDCGKAQPGHAGNTATWYYYGHCGLLQGTVLRPFREGWFSASVVGHEVLVHSLDDSDSPAEDEQETDRWNQWFATNTAPTTDSLGDAPGR